MRLFTLLFITGLVTFSSAQLINESKNIIKDTKTNYLWQDNKAVKMELRDFKNAVNYCKNLELDGQKGWKLPGFGELFSLVDTKSYNPTLFKGFKNFASDNYWTTKMFGHGASHEAFVIDFKSGAFNRQLMDEKFFVRCCKNAFTIFKIQDFFKFTIF